MVILFSSFRNFSSLPVQAFWLHVSSSLCAKPFWTYKIKCVQGHESLAGLKINESVSKQVNHKKWLCEIIRHQLWWPSAGHQLLPAKHSSFPWCHAGQSTLVWLEPLLVLHHFKQTKTYHVLVRENYSNSSCHHLLEWSLANCASLSLSFLCRKWLMTGISLIY